MPTELTIQQLTVLKNTTDPGQLTKLLNAYAAFRLKRTSVIKTYHDLLLFFCAFPANKKILSLATSELNRITDTAFDISCSKNTALKSAFIGSGIRYSELQCSYSLPITGWLVDKFKDDVEFGFSEASADTVRNIMQLLIPAVEYEKSTQGEQGLSSRKKKISGIDSLADQLKWLVSLFENSELPEAVKDELYQQLKVYVKWKLTGKDFNRSFLKSPVKKIFYQTKIIKNVISHKIIKQKIIKEVSLSKAEKPVWLEIMKSSLAFQYRETDPVTYGDAETIDLFELGRGLQLVVAGMVKERRLSLESYIGFMVFKNAVPVSYGGGWIWGQRCKIGVNIYPSFRRGESAWMFCQVMRVYYNHFGVRHFIVKPYQFGKGNPEGLKSGAFWFYYKLGFRPENAGIQKHAAGEWEKFQIDPTYRTPLKTLQHFTVSTLHLGLNNKTFPGFDAGKISASISNMINHDFKSNRNTAILKCMKKMKELIPAGSLKKSTQYQKRVLENWSLLLALCKDAAQWSPAQKKMLLQLIRLKQTGSEKDYILKLQKHTYLWRSLEEAITQDNP